MFVLGFHRRGSSRWWTGCCNLFLYGCFLQNLKSFHLWWNVPGGFHQQQKSWLYLVGIFLELCGRVYVFICILSVYIGFVLYTCTHILGEDSFYCSSSGEDWLWWWHSTNYNKMLKCSKQESSVGKSSYLFSSRG